ncbi:hypothetical protein M1316_01185 [Candidatus Parvarchaeota archaeon]|nr:hypothetical protein [Candidatus Parvarchaeota archaeon]
MTPPILSETPKRFSDSIGLSERSPLLAFWFDIVPIGFIISLIANKAANVTLLLPHGVKQQGAYYYTLFILFMLLGLALLFIYFKWLSIFRTLDDAWDNVYKKNFAGKEIPIYYETKMEINNYLKQWGRYLLLMLLLISMFLCDINLMATFSNNELSSYLNLIIFIIIIVVFMALIEVSGLYFSFIIKKDYKRKYAAIDGLFFGKPE